MSHYNYVDASNLNSNLICCICRLPFTEPTTTRTCAHTFCKDCILQAIHHSPQCPIDRSALVPEDLLPASPIVRSLVDELMVECVYNAEGCKHTCQRQLLAAHLLSSCLYRRVPCPRGKCPEGILFKDAVGHNHGEDDIDVDPKDQTADSEGLPKNFLSESVQVQLCACSNSAPREDVHSSPARVAVLVEQNILLRHRIQGLESLIQTLQRDMVAVKRALGPWSRTNGGAGPTVYSPTDVSADGEPAATVIHGGSSSLPDAQSSSGLSRYQPLIQIHPGSSPPADTLAPYFPPELGSGSSSPPTSSPENRRHRSLPIAELLPAPQHDPHAYLSNAFPHAPLIAPLNLSTTLEGTFHGLRESLIGLAASVDSMGRRHEIALTHETVRMTEEIGGLRAGIHGLRMQVHSIMVDRNANMTGRDGVREGPAPPWMPLPAPPPVPIPPPRMHHLVQPSITKL